MSRELIAGPFNYVAYAQRAYAIITDLHATGKVTKDQVNELRDAVLYLERRLTEKVIKESENYEAV
jgi:hypothetical protein